MYNKLLAIFSVSLFLFNTNASEQCLADGTVPIPSAFDPSEETEEHLVLNRLLTIDELDTVCRASFPDFFKGIAQFLAAQCSNAREEVTVFLNNPYYQTKIGRFFYTCSNCFLNDKCDAWLLHFASCIYCGRFCTNPANGDMLEKFGTVAGTVILVGWISANKFFIDHAHSNKAFHKVFGVPLCVINQSEAVFLEGIDFRCNIPVEEMLAAETFMINFLYKQNKSILDYLSTDTYRSG